MLKYTLKNFLVVKKNKYVTYVKYNKFLFKKQLDLL